MENYKSFEDWLHNEIHPHIALADGKLDDDWPDHESEWLAGLSVEEWFSYADRYAKIQVDRAEVRLHAEYLTIIKATSQAKA